MNIVNYHPLDMSDCKVSQAHQSKEYKEGKLKAYSRKIKPSWYEKYSWIRKCTSKFLLWQNFLQVSKFYIKVCKLEKGSAALSGT